MRSVFKTIVKKSLELLPKQIRYSVYRALVKVPDEIPTNLVFKIAETKEELESALVMLHDAYVDIGLLGKPDPSRIRVTPYHALPSTTTIVGKVGDEVVATMTIVKDSPMGLALDTYADLTELRKGGDRIAEISALAIKPGYRGKLLLHLMKFMYEICVNYLGINHIVCTLTKRTKNHELYESILFFTPFREQKQVISHSLNNNSLIAMHLNLDTAYISFEKHYSGRSKKKDLFQFFTKSMLECNRFPERHFNMVNFAAMNLENFRYFFTERTSVLKSLSQHQVGALFRIYQGMPQETIITEIHSLQNLRIIKGRPSGIRFDISLKTQALSEDKRILPVRILDVSREGLKISSSHKLSGLLEVQMKDPSGQTISLSVRRVWQDRFGVCGFQIVNGGSCWNQIIDRFEEQRTNGNRTIHDRAS